MSVRLPLLLLALPLAGCTPRFLEPTDGPRATLVLPVIHEGGKSALVPALHIYTYNDDCSERMVVPVGENREGGKFTIPAGEEITVGFTSDITGRPDAIIGVDGVPSFGPGNIKACTVVFTFKPRDGETYTPTEPLQASGCKLELRDSSNAPVPYVRREPVRQRPHTDLDPWCEQLPKSCTSQSLAPEPRLWRLTANLLPCAPPSPCLRMPSLA